MFWEFRDPVRWWGYFAAGWLAGTQVDCLVRLNPHRTRAVGLGLLVAWLFLVIARIVFLPAPWSPAMGVLEYLCIYAAVLGLFLFYLCTQPHPILEFLSNASYPIYLYHLFFVDLARQALGPATFTNRSLTFAFALPATLAFVVVARRLLGRHAATWLG